MTAAIASTSECVSDLCRVKMHAQQKPKYIKEYHDSAPHPSIAVPSGYPT